MFYRRKILLALIEAFGGTLTKTDCQKLLFLFCQRRGKNYYDFFPHKYGNFSLILAQDKNRLADLGLLTSHSDFQLQDSQSYSDQLEAKDRAALHDLVTEIGSVRGEKLIRKVYLEEPQYASRSQIAREVLKDTEYMQVQASWNKEHMPCLFTLGYEGLSIDAYLNLLVSYNINTLVDVRKNPLSMKYGFSKKRLSDYTKLAGINYIHIPGLGVPSNLRKELNSEKAYKDLFEFYSAHILPDRTDELEKLKSIISDQGRVAITCFEADHHFCHRHKVAEYLEHDPSFDTQIVHLYKSYSDNAKNKMQNLQNGLWEQNGLYYSI
ncbi:DUF488 family protein [Ktedonobacter racemifer]|uniref:DUF488 domain-containing protein n=1 Tax=Ktedonobacter racemifer DSM 44963 TaxID=485913 RepID=D6TLY2_KTERA|nr:DUF488 domain-containing protein [Ktedonobacter racemifer]EFH86782.1 protein of unknown function DUF1130 [Ktedonobacter racemifer DSM 44963]